MNQHAASEFRDENDLIGERMIPRSAYWGINSLRAAENFPISGELLSDTPDLIAALAMIKQAAVEANFELGQIDAPRRDAIRTACIELAEGRLHDQFIVDLIQGGAGTSTNMNANEVIANRALELMGLLRGNYGALHPNDHVNLGQSTNDVYPSALKLAAYAGVMRLLPQVAALREAFAQKAAEFADVLKMGRTQLQDAVPMTLGQEFATHAAMLADDERHLQAAGLLLLELNLGGTAIGTGLTAPAGYAPAICRHLQAISGLPVSIAADPIASTQDCGSFLHLSSMLRRLATHLSKTCNDLRLLSSGPRAGLGEINLPACQAGSSIMPGKVNPVIPEVVNQVAFEVIGNDLTIVMAAEAGQLQLNAFEPIIFLSLHRSLSHLAAACATLKNNCVVGITANRDHLRHEVDRSIGLVAALNPYIGYGAATAIAQEALHSGRGIREIVLERGLLPAHELDDLMSPEKLTRPAG